MCFGAEAADYRTEAYPAYHAHRPEMPDGPRGPVGAGAGVLRGVRVDGARPRRARGRRPHALARARRGAPGRQRADLHRRPRHVPVRHRQGARADAAGAQGLHRDGPGGGEERYGIGPELVPDFIALRGDPSDGLPGAKGIGEKTAADILQRKGDLEHAILGAIREKPSVRRALIEQAASCAPSRRSRRWWRSRWTPCRTRRPTAAGGAKAAEALGMKRLAERLRQARAGLSVRAGRRPSAPCRRRRARSRRRPGCAPPAPRRRAGRSPRCRRPGS